MKATAEQHVRVVRHLMDFAGLARDSAEFIAVEAWAVIAPIVEDAIREEAEAHAPRR